MSGSPLVEVSRPSAGVVLLRMANLPVNAWTDSFIDAMEQVVEDLHANSARVVVITGSNGYFSAGGDFNRFLSVTDADTARAFVERAQQVMDKVAAIACPVIAAINGAALGGGLELALACDIRIAGTTAVMGLPETRWGILAGAGGTQRLARLVGPGVAKRLMYTAAPVDAAEALRIGLVEMISSQPDPLEDAVALACTICVNSPRAIRNVKRCVDEGLDLDLSAGLAHERDLWVDLIPDGDLQEGAAAFFERRDPHYPDVCC